MRVTEEMTPESKFRGTDTVIIIISSSSSSSIKDIYIAQVRKSHKCAMSAEMAVWLRNWN